MRRWTLAPVIALAVLSAGGVAVQASPVDGPRPVTAVVETPSLFDDDEGGNADADVVSTPLPGFPNGLLVVHDGENTPESTGSDGEVRTDTNFKFLDAGVLLG